MFIEMWSPLLFSPVRAISLSRWVRTETHIALTGLSLYFTQCYKHNVPTGLKRNTLKEIDFLLFRAKIFTHLPMNRGTLDLEFKLKRHGGYIYDVWDKT